MGVTLRRTSFSPNIKERLDFSCAFFDAEGSLVAQAAHIPVHLGAMPASVVAALKAVEDWQPGDVVALNDPYEGGNHLPDITMVSPVFDGDRITFFAASRAHHADVGGMTPGSLPLSTEIYQEGIIIPPVKLWRAGVLNEDLLKLIVRNVRTPHERRGDIAAQHAAHAVGERRLHALMDRYSTDEVLRYASYLYAYSERLMRTEIATWPAGTFGFADRLELPGGGSATIRVKAYVSGDDVTFDFAGTDGVINTSLNTVPSVTEAACYYAALCMSDEDIPVNAGCFAPVKVLAPYGTIVNASAPAAVAGGNVETSQRITDVVFGALAQSMPDRVPAASQGTMNNVTIGGMGSDGKPFAYYETIGGGMGAAPSTDGLSGVHVHMSNTLNTPVEALELAFPFRIREYSLVAGSGGAGKRRGGDGIAREYELLAPAMVTMLSERRRTAPWGLQGGRHGRAGCNLLITADGKREELPAKFSRHLVAGDHLRIETPGGGGWGLPD